MPKGAATSVGAIIATTTVLSSHAGTRRILSAWAIRDYYPTWRHCLRAFRTRERTRVAAWRVQTRWQASYGAVQNIGMRAFAAILLAGKPCTRHSITRAVTFGYDLLYDTTPRTPGAHAAYLFFAYRGCCRDYKCLIQPQRAHFH